MKSLLGVSGNLSREPFSLDPETLITTIECLVKFIRFKFCKNENNPSLKKGRQRKGDEMGSKKMKKGTRNLSLETNWDCGNREEEVGVHERGAVELLKLLQVQSIRLR